MITYFSFRDFLSAYDEIMEYEEISERVKELRMLSHVVINSAPENMTIVMKQMILEHIFSLVHEYERRQTDFNLKELEDFFKRKTINEQD